MIEKKFVKQRLKEIEVQNYVAANILKSGHSAIEIKHTPLGDKIIIYNVRPGLIVGKKGENISRLTQTLKTKFNLENPQIEVGDVSNPMLDASAVADKLAYALERFGPKRFKFLGHETLKAIIDAGAIGAEIVIGGVGVPGARAKSWRFSAGHLKKSGDVSASYVLRSNTVANLKRGTIGIKISIIPPDVILPDNIKVKEKRRKIKGKIKQHLKKKKKGLKMELRKRQREIKRSLKMAIIKKNELKVMKKGDLENKLVELRRELMK